MVLKIQLIIGFLEPFFIICVVKLQINKKNTELYTAKKKH